VVLRRHSNGLATPCWMRANLRSKMTSRWIKDEVVKALGSLSVQGPANPIQSNPGRAESRRASPKEKGAR
jgi:hypothetical protein